MIYGAYADLTGGFSEFEESGLDKKVVLGELATQANLMEIKLRKMFKSLPVQAAGFATATGNVSDGDTVKIGGVTYTFKTTTTAAYDVKIGADAAASMANLNSAIAQADTGEYHTGTAINTTVESTRSGVVLTLKARKCGLVGNDITLTTTSASLTLVGFSGGQDEVLTLSSLNIWLTVLSLLTGQAMSIVSGTSQEPLIEQLGKQIDSAWTTLGAANSLVTVTGDVLDAKSMCPVYSNPESED